jgi:hypothetical protein
LINRDIDLEDKLKIDNFSIYRNYFVILFEEILQSEIQWIKTNNKKK